MRVVPLALRRDPVDVLASLAEEPGAFLVDVPGPDRPMTLLGCAPHVQLRIRPDGSAERSDGTAVEGDPLAAVARFVAEADAGGLPFPLGACVVGFLAYELGRLIEPPRDQTAHAPDLPLAVLGRYDALLAYDRRRGQYALVARDPGAPVGWLERLATPCRTRAVWPGPLATAPLAPLLSRQRYLAAVERILGYLAAGDVYQVNLTQPFTAPLAAPAWALAARLARLHAEPHGAYLDLGGAQLVANSPELFLRRRGTRVETRPIKGTRARGAGAAHDAALAAELARDPKERAEHVMIVDLERNDLGRVCVAGSVVVEELARVESHPTVHHLVSTVAGRLRADVGLAELLRATFPGGSITGAPKVRAMEIIRELEAGPRGPYTGAFGLFHPGGDLELGLAIRTAVVRDGAVEYHAGGGVVADSDPERELAECWLKTAALRLALGEEPRPGLGAVLVWLNGRVLPARAARVAALDRGLLHGDGVYDTWRTYGGEPYAVAAHVRRLAAAARVLGLAPPAPPADWARRTRLLLRRNTLLDAAARLTITRGNAGEAPIPTRRVPPTLLLTLRPLPPDLARRQAEGITAVLLPFPRDAGPPWGGLKLIGHASAVAGRRLAARRHADEGLYVTAAGEVTEATTANLFVVERDLVVTPPLAAGVLPGVTRAVVLALARRAGLRPREEPVSVARLRRARESFLTASTIEVLPVVRLDGRAVAAGRPGPVTRLLQARYTAHVRTALARQRDSARRE